MKSTAKNWITDLREKNPDLPRRLTVDVERDRLDRLSDWFDRLEKNREIYDEYQEELDVPESFEEIRGGRQIIPALATPMSPDEREAKHDLFVCLSALLANITYRHWQKQAGKDSAITFRDALNYLPVAFLFVLAGYDADREGGSHEVDFSNENADWIRLSTWIYQDFGRHIEKYLRNRSHIVDRGSGYIQNIKQKIRQIRNQKYSEEGRRPSDEEVAKELKDQLKENPSDETVMGHVRTLSSSEDTVSMEDTVSQTSGEDLKFGDVVSGDAGESVKEIYDPLSYLKNRIDREPLLRACKKIAFGEDPLTFRERHHFSL